MNSLYNKRQALNKYGLEVDQQFWNLIKDFVTEKCKIYSTIELSTLLSGVLTVMIQNMEKSMIIKERLRMEMKKRKE